MFALESGRSVPGPAVMDSCCSPEAGAALELFISPMWLSSLSYTKSL